MNIILRKFENITSDLLNELISLDQSCFPCPWSNESWANCLDNFSNYELYIYRDDSKHLIGFSLYQISKLENLAHLLKIIINPLFRSKGLASKAFSSNLISLNKKSLYKIFLEVETTNNAAISLYKKCGLEVIHTKKNFYGSERHAYIMMKA